jgi:hypothetical protein
MASDTYSGSEQSLIAKAQYGDEAAFTEILQRYQRPIVDFVYRMVGNADTANDSESGKGPAGDERLSTLLHEWKGIEPQADFEAVVWRRIRAYRVADRGCRRFVETWREWLAPLPAWVNVAAAAAGIVVGGGRNERYYAGRSGTDGSVPCV